MKEEYIEALEALVLPVEEERLEATHQRALSAALAAFDENSFGVTGSPDLNVRTWVCLPSSLILAMITRAVHRMMAGIKPQGRRRRSSFDVGVKINRIPVSMHVERAPRGIS